MTNVIGFQIGAYGYMELRISLYQDQKNPYKKVPKITANIGTVLSLAILTKRIPVVDYIK
jgi:amino acid permease